MCVVSSFVGSAVVGRVCYIDRLFSRAWLRVMVWCMVLCDGGMVVRMVVCSGTWCMVVVDAQWCI